MIPKLSTGRVLRLISTLVLLAVFCPGIRAQDQQSGNPSESSSSKKYKGGVSPHDFLVKGTVFTPQGLAFPGVTLHIRREGDKKFKWQRVSNARGEFAILVPPGTTYEVVAKIKGYKDLSKTVTATGMDGEELMAFRMETVEGNKK